MAKISFTVTEEELARFKAEAESRGMSLSGWLRTLARERVGENGVGGDQRRVGKRVHTGEDREAFFRKIDALHGPNPKPSPTWEEINRIVDEGMRERHSSA